MTLTHLIMLLALGDAVAFSRTPTAISLSYRSLTHTVSLTHGVSLTHTISLTHVISLTLSTRLSTHKSKYVDKGVGGADNMRNTKYKHAE